MIPTIVLIAFAIIIPLILSGLIWLNVMPVKLVTGPSRERTRRPPSRGRIFILTLVGLFLIFLGTYYLIGFLSGNFLLGGILGLILMTVTAILPVPLFVFSPRNMFFTSVPEGAARAIVRGDKFEKILIEWRLHTIDEHTWEITDITEAQEQALKAGYSWFRRTFGGRRYYGIWPLLDVKKKKFRWTSKTEDGRIQHNEEVVAYILLVQYLYLVEIKKAEAKDKVPLNLELQMTLNVTNPYKALFDVHDWLEVIINKIRPFFRELVAQRSYETVLAGGRQLAADVKTKLENTGLITEFETLYGVTIQSIGVAKVDPPPELRELTLIVARAKQRKEAAKIAAQAESLRIRRVYKTIQEFGPLGELIRALEAIQKSPLAAALTVQHVPGLADILKTVFDKSPKEVTKRDIELLRSSIEELNKQLQKQKQTP